jgi:uncharacterized protein (DUF58 family)
MSAAPSGHEPATFRLVPRWRVTGLAYGPYAAMRRGGGSDVVGSRAYEPGDDVRAIDWAASARRSTALGRDEFVVREHHSEEAPRVVVVCDRRPTMGLYAPPFSWLSKPRALQAALEVIVESTLRVRGLVGYLDHAGGDERWRAPGGGAGRWEIEHLDRGALFDAPADSLARAVDDLTRRRADVPAGTFVFVLSDFLVPLPAASWLDALQRRWDVVPVVMQDPLWEASFPALSGVVVPVFDPTSGARGLVRIGRRQARGLRAANERRHADLLADLAGYGLDPIVLPSDDHDDVASAFCAWGEERSRHRGVW